ncbi:MAG: hypothetical protein RBS07_16430 [Lentimicrobium sp.]|jgi:hydroxymethylglutaryl-CoA lyase|nr:hypothetical protein [Lentimicrobium sp.]
MKNENQIKLTESPRDAQQGLPYVIAPEKRAAYINALLKVGFDVVDFGSFVSPKAIPQMADQKKVLELVDKSGSDTKLMAIVGNVRGGQDAANQEKVDILGFPYSTSETFLKKNINADSLKALDILDELLEISEKSGKTLRVFMSMAYGNPYNDPWSIGILEEHINLLSAKGIRTITLADTIGIASAELISVVYSSLVSNFSDHEFGLHIHTRSNEWHEKLEAAWNAGCRWFEGVISGIGGCPMTGYEMVGNLNTLHLLEFLKSKNAVLHINRKVLEEAVKVGF